MNSTSAENRGSEDFSELIKPFVKRWTWFVIAGIVALFLALVYLRYTTPDYAVRAKIQILEDQRSTSEMNAFRDLEILSGGTNKVEDEIEIINSRSNFVSVVKKLGLNTKIMAQGRIHDTEKYVNPPVKINFLGPDSLVYQANDNFKIRISSDTEFIVLEDDEFPDQKFSFGTTIPSSYGGFVITPNERDLNVLIDKEYEIRIRPIIEVAKAYQERILITINNELSNIISIGLNDPVPEKGVDIINSLIETYNQNAIDDKQQIANKTSEFINARIADIYGDLSTVDDSAEEFKSTRGITDVSSQSNINLNVGAQSRQELRNAQVQLNIATSMKSIIDNQAGFEVLPANLASDASISSATGRYNELVLERNRILRSSNERNPIIVNLDQQLSDLKQSLRSSLESMINNLTLQVNNLSGQLSRINSQIYSAPGNERALRDISRQQQTTEALYLYLLQKREESQISFASTSPKSKVIDWAYQVSLDPVSPKKLIVLIAALVLGMLLPFSYIYLAVLLDTKVHNKLGLEGIVGDVPVLSELPKLEKKEKTLVKTADRSVLAESMRILRTNLDYLLRSQANPQIGKFVFVTSSVPGEGKTFVASNLAMIYAKANKRVLLIGGDIRNPKIDQFYSGKNVDKLKRVSGNKDNKGLTDYLIDESLTARDITNTMLVTDQTVDIIHSGKLRPNPAELLMNLRLDHLVQEVRENYDYIIVDTAPMVVVSDTLLMTKFADMVLYVTRAEVTNKKVLEFPLKMMKEGKIKNLSFVINGVKDSNLGYGGKYGYGYGKSQKKWWKFAS